MKIAIVENVADGAQLWDDYVQASTASSMYHLFEWKRVIEDTFGHRTTYLAARNGSGIAGVLPLAELSSRVFGKMMVSLPFFNYGGICAESPEASSTLLNAAIELARERRVDFLEIRHQEKDLDDLPMKTSKVSMRLPLPASADALWKALGSKLRNQVQKPRKEGLTVVVGRGELLDEFYDVFSVNMRDLGTPVYPKALFGNTLARFPQQTWIAVVRKESMPIAAGFLAGFKDHLEIPWGSSLRRYNRLSPNMLLYWTCLEFACHQNYRVFDFGRSTQGESTYRFKEQWGAKPHPLYWYYWLPRGHEIPQVNPANPKYRAAIAVWQRLPIGVTRLIGPSIVKYIP